MLFAIDDSSELRTLRMTGRLDATGVAAIWTDAHRALADLRRPVTVDAAGVDYCDGAGLALLFDLQRARPQVSVHGLRPEFQALLDQFAGRNFTAASPPVSPPLGERLLRHLGATTRDVVVGAQSQVAFLGEASAALAAAIRKPSSVRWKDALLVAERAGVDALPIVALIAFLMGVIIAFQSAIPMKQFGAEVFVADLVGLSMLRELGPLMTAILLAGRSGAAFAAEIGTMKVNEEINALTTMGLDPVRFLVTTRLIAAVVVTPLLTIFADLVGLVGGALTMLSFSIPTVTYFSHLSGLVGFGDFASGLVKSVVFGILIAGIGCLRGLQTKNGAAAVGQSTTSAVVSAIVMIVVVDGLFAWIYYVLDI